MNDLRGKTVLLTGASSGIGAATATILGEAGAHIVSHYRSDIDDRAAAERALAAVPGERKKFIAADYADLASVDRLWKGALAWRGRIDVLVLNAAITKIHDPIEDSDPESWTESWTSQWQVNVLGPARLMCAAIPQLKKQGGGVIVTMSSWVANRGASSPTQMAYAASKAGITAAARTVARAYARDNILCYMIAPGIVRTKMSEDFAAVFGGEEKLTATLAMGEWVPPGEIGHLIAFLATGKCRHLTGATLDVNGATYVR